MKRILIPLLFSALTFGIASCSCSNNNQEQETQKELVSIEVSGDYKTEYYVGDTFDRTGLVVNAVYDDGSKEAVTSYRTTGFNSEVEGTCEITVTYKEKTTSFRVSIVPMPLPTKVDITLKVMVSGVNSYEEGHSKIYINASFIDSPDGGWGTTALTQDAENKDLWTINISQIEAGQVYDYALYFGDEFNPDWTNGKCNGLDSQSNLHLEVEESQLVYDIAASFVVPEIGEVLTLDLILSADVQETVDSEPVYEIPEGIYIWAWNNITNSVVKFDRMDGSENVFKYTFEVGLDKATGSASLQYTAILGDANSPNSDWDTFGAGAYENGDWVRWNNGNTITVNNESTIYTENVHFKNIPEVTEPVDELNVEVKFVLDVPQANRGYTYELRVGDSIWHGDNEVVATFALEEGEPTARYTFKSDAKYFSINASTEGFAWPAGIVSDASWHAFKLKLDENVEEASIRIQITQEISEPVAYYDTVVSPTGCHLE